MATESEPPRFVQRTAVMRVVPLDFEHGKWCPACALPSAYLAHVIIEGPGEGRWCGHLHSFLRCLDCGAEWDGR